MAKHAVFEGRSEDDYADSVNESWLGFVLPPIQTRLQKRDRGSNTLKSVLHLGQASTYKANSGFVVQDFGVDFEIKSTNITVACIYGGDNEMSSKGTTTAAVSTNHELRLIIEVEAETTA